MGLDMYLYRTAKVPEFTPKDYITVYNYVEEMLNSRNRLAAGGESSTTFTESLDLEAGTGLAGANVLQGSIRLNGDPEFMTWYSIFEEVAYWRKANEVHAWFVKTVEDGIDECQLGDPLTQGQLTELRDRAKLVMASRPEIQRPVSRVQQKLTMSVKETLAALVQDARSPFGERQAAAVAIAKIEPGLVAQLLLPPQEGFFFGSTDIDEYYYNGMTETYQQLDRVLESTDFETQVVFYQSSW